MARERVGALDDALEFEQVSRSLSLGRETEKETVQDGGVGIWVGVVSGDGKVRFQPLTGTRVRLEQAQERLQPARSAAGEVNSPFPSP